MPAAAAALSPSEQQPVRTWWSLSRSPSTKDLRQGYDKQQSKSSGKFTSFASAIGLKSKKHTPSLAIQEPPPPVPPVVKIHTSTRPPSTRTRVDSFEPRTPVDLKRQSLLTLSDADPFAGRSVIPVPSDPNRLSAYSNPSVTDFLHKKPDTPTFNRVSYASSSSNSHVHAIEILPAPPVSNARITSEFRRLHNKYVTAIFTYPHGTYLTSTTCRRSVGSLQVKHAEPLARQSSLSPSVSPSSNLGLSYVYRRSQPDPAVTRPKMRARGMTDGGSTQKAGFFVQDHPPSRKLSHTSSSSNNFVESSSTNLPISQDYPISPKLIIRQASVSRLQTPPTAPPTQRLPPPPSQADEPVATQRPGMAYRVESALSSSLSFGSTTSPAAADGVQDNERRISKRGRQTQQQHEPDNLVGPPKKDSKTAPGSPRTLKKSNSHQTLSRRDNHTSPSATPKTPPEATFRKPRNLARLPIPHIPLSGRPSSASNATSFPSLPEFGGNQTPTSDSRKGTSGRRRLFSGSSISKLSLSHQTSNRDDDTLSTFSLRSDHDPHLGPYKPSLSKKGTRPSSSFWDEASDHTPASPVTSTLEYTPQVIMSREELARLEESVENTPEYSTRSRGFSVLSTSTMASDYDKGYDFSPVGLSPPPATRSNSKQMQTRMSSNSFSAKQSSTLSRPNSPPPSILSTASDHSSMQTMSSSPSPQTLVMTSLPPPPRRRRPTVISEPDLPNPTPPPFPSHISIQKSSSMRSKFTVEKSLHRQSILRKPSFLDISDDSDQATESEVDELVTGSFLDLARESFDTIRSEA